MLPLIRPGQLIKHAGCLDLCLYILRNSYEDAKRYKLKVFFCDSKGRTIFPTAQNVEIKRNQLHLWRNL